MITCSRHYDILAETSSRMTTAITFSCQNDADSRVSNTQYWENLVLVVVLVSESKALKWKKREHPQNSPMVQFDTTPIRFTLNPKMTNNIYSRPLFQLMTEPGFVPHAQTFRTDGHEEQEQQKRL